MRGPLASTALVLLLAGVSLYAQEPEPTPGEPGQDQPPATPAEEDGPDDPVDTLPEDRLRQLNGELVMRLLRRNGAHPQEWSRLRIEVAQKGKLVDRHRRVDVSHRAVDGLVTLRLRFLEPPAKRGEAWLVEETADGVRARRYLTSTRKSERVKPPTPGERVAGSGLTWGDLRADYGDDTRWAFKWEARLVLPTPSDEQRTAPPARNVLVLERKEEDANRRLHVDRKQFVLLLQEDLDPAGKPLKVRWEGRHKRVAGRLRPFSVQIVEREAERVSTITLEFVRPGVPKAHFDPDRFWEKD